MLGKPRIVFTHGCPQTRAQLLEVKGGAWAPNVKLSGGACAEIEASHKRIVWVIDTDEASRTESRG